MKRITTGLALLLGTFALAACGDAEVAEAPAALNRVVAEQPGKNCAAGGQAIQLGVDVNGSGALDDDEVKGTSYVCNGVAAKPEVAPVAAGDPRCPNGGTVLKVAGSSDVVACNGAQGAQGAQGVAGAQGDAGAQGAPPAELVLGQFLASQVVKGVVVTCASATVNATVASCTGMKVNGIDARLGAAEASAVCNAITGKGYNSASGSATAATPYMVWTNGAWALQDTGSVAPMQNVHCNK